MPNESERKFYWEKSAEKSRSYEAYERFLDIKDEEIEGKTILDLGSGEHEDLKQEMEKRSKKTKVISLNPKLGLNSLEGKTAREKSTSEKVVAGIAQQLPFKNESIDIILSLDAVPLYLPFKDSEYQDAFSEIDRILKNGGIAKMYPIRKSEKESENKKSTPLERVLELLKSKGYEVIWKEIKVSDEEIEQYQTLGGWQLTIRKP